LNITGNTSIATFINVKSLRMNSTKTLPSFVDDTNLILQTELEDKEMLMLEVERIRNIRNKEIAWGVVNMRLLLILGSRKYNPTAAFQSAPNE